MYRLDTLALLGGSCNKDSSRIGPRCPSQDLILLQPEALCLFGGKPLVNGKKQERKKMHYLYETIAVAFELSLSVPIRVDSMNSIFVTPAKTGWSKIRSPNANPSGVER